MIRTVIADDELLARKKLHILLDHEPGLNVIAECKTGDEAVAALQRLRPDLLFLDIQMPAQDGFEVLQAVPAAARPVVIFTTAHDKYAIRAFEARALDYLLKPFDRERLHSAVERVRGEFLKSTAAPPDLLHKNDHRFVFKSGGRILFLDVDEIDWIEASANYVRLHAGRESYSFRETIAHVLERLHVHPFVRIHRSLIVNVNRIKELQPCNSGEYIVVLKDGKELSCSRSYRGGLQDLIGEL